MFKWQIMNDLSAAITNNNRSKKHFSNIFCLMKKKTKLKMPIQRQSTSNVKCTAWYHIGFTSHIHTWNLNDRNEKKIHEDWKRFKKLSAVSFYVTNDVKLIRSDKNGREEIKKNCEIISIFKSLGMTFIIEFFFCCCFYNWYYFDFILRADMKFAKRPKKTFKKERMKERRC